MLPKSSEFLDEAVSKEIWLRISSLNILKTSSERKMCAFRYDIIKFLICLPYSVYGVVSMSTVVFSVRIDRRLKELMEQFPEVDWGEEVRKFLEKRVRELIKMKILGEADELREKLRREVGVLRSSAELVREDREER